MSRYTKKAVTIDAWNPGSQGFADAPAWFTEAVKAKQIILNSDGTFVIHCPRHGQLQGPKFNWVIRGVEGELYPCDPQVFAQTYEVAKEPPPGFLTRMGIELEELTTRITKGYAFAGSDDFRDLSFNEQALLLGQLAHMGQYQSALIRRLALAEGKQP